MKELVSKQLVRYLEGRGVTHIFGLCGHTNIAVLTELGKSSIRFVNFRHEQIAAHCADGYARAKKQTAVVLSHLGPGLTNAATGSHAIVPSAATGGTFSASNYTITYVNGVLTVTSPNPVPLITAPSRIMRSVILVERNLFILKKVGANNPILKGE